MLALGSTVLGGWQDSATPAGTVLSPYADKDAYLIYAILLESNKSTPVVIQTEKDSRSGATPENIGIKGDASFSKVWGVVVRDFAKQFLKPNLLARNIAIEVPYELVPKQKIRQIFESAGKWDLFYERYPLSGGYYSFSAVGFDAMKVHAIVQMNHYCGMLCGGGGPRFFEKKNGKWLEVSVKASVTFWAS
jgi:hypothetical protein